LIRWDRVSSVGLGGVSSSSETETWFDKTKRIAHKGAHIASDALSDLFGTTKYLYCLSLFLQSIINAVNEFKDPLKTTSVFAQKFVVLNKGLICLVDGVMVFIDLKDIFVPDEKGRWIWERHGEFIIEKLLWTASHSLDFIEFLRSIELFEIGVTAVKVLGVGAVIFKVAACAFGIFEKTRSIRQTKQKNIKVTRLKNEWQERAEGWTERTRLEVCQQKIMRCQEKLKNLPKGDLKKIKKAKHCLKKWILISQCKNMQKLKDFCLESAKKNAVKSTKCTVKQVRSSVTIAFYACLIAISLFIVIAYYAKLNNVPAIRVGLVVFPIVFTSIEMLNLAIYKLIALPKTPKVKLKLLRS